MEAGWVGLLGVVVAAVSGTVSALVTHWFQRRTKGEDDAAERDREAARTALAAYDAVLAAWRGWEEAYDPHDYEDADRWHLEKLAEFRRAVLHLRTREVRERLYDVVQIHRRLTDVMDRRVPEFLGENAVELLHEEVETVLGAVIRNMRPGVVQPRDLDAPGDIIERGKRRIAQYEGRKEAERGAAEAIYQAEAARVAEAERVEKAAAAAPPTRVADAPTVPEEPDEGPEAQAARAAASK